MAKLKINRLNSSSVQKIKESINWICLNGDCTDKYREIKDHFQNFIANSLRFYANYLFKNARWIFKLLQVIYHMKNKVFITFYISLKKKCLIFASMVADQIHTYVH